MDLQTMLLYIKLKTGDDDREEIKETLQAQVVEEGELPGEGSQMRTVLSPLHDARIDDPSHGLQATPQALAPKKVLDSRNKEKRTELRKSQHLQYVKRIFHINPKHS